MVHQYSLNQKESKDFRQEQHKPYANETPKIEPLFSQIWEENQREKNHEGFMHTSLNKSSRKQPRNLSKKKRQKRAPKITKKNEQEQHIQASRNRAESSIHHKEVHTRSSLLPDHPSLSQDLIMKLSS
jgi:hypothetical protein